MWSRVGLVVWVALGVTVAGCGSSSMSPDAGASGPCAADVDCDDGVFCNGQERCLPTALAADARGCVQPGVACMALQFCDETARTCVTDCAIETDADGDGALALSCGGDDCDDANAQRFPGNTEVCDAAGLDEDCDPSTLASGTANDADQDSFVSTECCNLQTDGSLLCGRDCDDGALGGEVNPAASELCNGRDDDCDGVTDEGTSGATFYPDCDGDGFGRSEGGVAGTPGMCAAPVGVPSQCATGSAGLWAPNDRDCDDENEDVKPGVVEACNGVDDNCDGNLAAFEDVDQDGEASLDCGGSDCDDTHGGVGGCALTGARTYLWAVPQLQLGRVGGSGQVFGFDLDGRDSSAGDALTCNQADAVNVWGDPGADAELFLPDQLGDTFLSRYGRTYVVELSEVDGCDDPEATLSIYLGRYEAGQVSVDSQGMPVPGQRVALAGPAYTSFTVTIEGGVVRGEGISYRFPGAFENNPPIDNGQARGACLSEERLGYLVLGGFRSLSTILSQAPPDMPFEADADGFIDGESCSDYISEAWYFGPLVNITRAPDACRFADCDKDGWGTFAETSATCAPPCPGGEMGCGDPTDVPSSCPDGQWSDTIGDCDDTDASFNPQGMELCDGLDRNCNGQPSEFWVDRDLDGDGEAQAGCGGTDCHPGDPNLTLCDEEQTVCIPFDPVQMMEAMCMMIVKWLDCDGDGRGVDGTGLAQDQEEPPLPAGCESGSYVPDGGDCDDTNPMIYPGADEGCDMVDNDCDGSLGVAWEARDMDGDGEDSFYCGGQDCFPMDIGNTTCPDGQACILINGNEPACPP